jgi:LPXTG-site transpeptidase (sortase) family protein
MTSQGDPDGLIPQSTFTTPLTLNTDLPDFAPVERNDAQCVTYYNLPMGNYYYTEESYPDNGCWTDPVYNDQYETEAASNAMFPYDNTLFDSDSSNDDARDMNVDGHIVLHTERPHRTLVIYNRYTACQTPTVTPTIPPSGTPTATGIPGPSATETPHPSATPGPGPSATPGPGSSTSTQWGGTGGGELASGESTSRSPAVLGEESNLNPLIEGILESFNNVLGAQTKKLPKTGESASPEGHAKLPSGNTLELNVALDIPKINVHTLLHTGRLLGEELLIGNREVLEYGNIIYAHNSTGSFGKLVELNKGDMIYKTIDQTVHGFVVTDIARVNEYNTGAILKDNRALTLITCDFADNSIRIVVTAQKIN